MISTKRRVIVLSMKELKKDYSKSSVKDLTDFIEIKYNCTRYMARLCANELKSNTDEL
jgi:hypothetical protein